MFIIGLWSLLKVVLFYSLRKSYSRVAVVYELLEYNGKL
jgi:hypothetical protein